MKELKRGGKYQWLMPSIYIGLFVSMCLEPTTGWMWFPVPGTVVVVTASIYYLIKTGGEA